MILTAPFWSWANGKKAPSRAYQQATFAAGCFWCIQPPYDDTKGVIKTEVGYAGGSAENASYEKVARGLTAHYEVIQVTYDPSVVSYAELLDIFWKNIDPYNKDGQFCDRGDQYRSAIFYHNDQQKKLAQQTKKKIVEDPKYKKFTQVHTEIIAFKEFFRGEEYHQSYYKKNPLKYKAYRYACGRDKRLKTIWGK